MPIALFGGVFFAIIWEGAALLFSIARTIATLLHMGGVAVWCGDESNKAKVCRHKWVVQIRKALGYDA